MIANRSIAFRLILAISICSACILSGILGYNYYRSRALLQGELEKNARNLALSSVNRVETFLTAVTRVTESVARSLSHGSHTHGERMALLRSTLEDNPELYGIGAAFEPEGPHPYVPYFHRNGARIIYETEDSFGYLRQDWYQISREMERKEWTEPYYDDSDATVLMASCSIPFFESKGGIRQLRGVVVADISLDWLTDLVGSISVLKSGYAFLISRNGTIVTHPDRGMIMNETIFSLAEARNDKALRTLGRKMIDGGTDFIPFIDFKGTRSWLYYAPIPSVGWTLAVVFPEAELLSQIRTLNLTGAAIGLAGIMLLAAVITWLARSITTPLHRLAEATAEIASGNFTVELPPVNSHDEVGTLTAAFQVMQSSLTEQGRPARQSRDEVTILTSAFQAMKNSLNQHIRQLTETTAAKERIESELNIAHDIQMGLLPKVFPRRREFELYATMKPAREVGGDFYDFFFIDQNRLCLVIADVAGKGVPAALFMAMSMTLIKATALHGLSPHEVLSRVNNQLAQDNDSCMFVTTFFAIMDVGSGLLEYANGGHNPPLHLKRDGTCSSLPISGSPMVGVIEKAPFRTEQLTMEVGDSLFLYTDGVTEAMNPHGKMYSENRLKHALSSLRGKDVRGMVDAVTEEMQVFSQEAPQSDDITILMIQYRGC